MLRHHALLVSPPTAKTAAAQITTIVETAKRHASSSSSSSSSSYVSRAEMEKEVDAFRALRRGRHQALNAGGLASFSYSLEDMATWDSAKWESIWTSWQRAALCGGALLSSSDNTNNNNNSAVVPPSLATTANGFVFRFDALSGQKLSGATCVNMDNQLKKFHEDIRGQSKSVAAVLSAAASPQTLSSSSASKRTISWGSASSANDIPVPSIAADDEGGVPPPPPAQLREAGSCPKPPLREQQDPPLPSLSKEQLILTICQRCPYWLFSRSSLDPDHETASSNTHLFRNDAREITKKRVKMFTPLFPGIVTKNDMTNGAPSSGTASHTKAICQDPHAGNEVDVGAVDAPLLVSLACLSDDHRQDFYRMFPLRSNQRATDGRIAAAKNRHVVFRDNAFSYVHSRAENELLSARHAARYNTYSWVPLQELVACRQRIVANLAVHEDDADAVARLLSALMSNKIKNWTRASRHFSMTDVDDVTRHVSVAMSNVTNALSMMGETKTCFLVPLQHSAARCSSQQNSGAGGNRAHDVSKQMLYHHERGGGGSTAAMSYKQQGSSYIEHLVPLAFAVGHML
jgi:hypothetical protein